MICSRKRTLLLKEIAWCILGVSKKTNPSIHQSKAHKFQNNNQTLLFSNAFNSEEYSSHAQYGLSHHARKYVFFKYAPFRSIEFPFRKCLRFLQPKNPQLTKESASRFGKKPSSLGGIQGANNQITKLKPLTSPRFHAGNVLRRTRPGSGFYFPLMGCWNLYS